MTLTQEQVITMTTYLFDENIEQFLQSGLYLALTGTADIAEQSVTQREDTAVYKVFPSTNCPYHGVKVTWFGKSVKVLTREFSAFTIKSLRKCH